jgi:hypothetical protein
MGQTEEIILLCNWPHLLRIQHGKKTGHPTYIYIYPGTPGFPGWSWAWRLSRFRPAATRSMNVHGKHMNSTVTLHSRMANRETRTPCSTNAICAKSRVRGAGGRARERESAHVLFGCRVAGPVAQAGARRVRSRRSLARVGACLETRVDSLAALNTGHAHTHQARATLCETR